MQTCLTLARLSPLSLIVALSLSRPLLLLLLTTASSHAYRRRSSAERPSEIQSKHQQVTATPCREAAPGVDSADSFRVQQEQMDLQNGMIRGYGRHGSDVSRLFHPLMAAAQLRP